MTLDTTPAPAATAQDNAPVAQKAPEKKAAPKKATPAEAKAVAPKAPKEPKAPPPPVTFSSIGAIRGISKSLSLQIVVGGPGSATGVPGLDSPLLPKDAHGRPGILRSALQQYLFPGLQQVVEFAPNLLLIGSPDQALDAIEGAYGNMLHQISTASFTAAHEQYVDDFAGPEAESVASEADILAAQGAPAVDPEMLAMQRQELLKSAINVSGLSLSTGVLLVDSEPGQDALAFQLPELHATVTASATDRVLLGSGNQVRDLLRHFDTLRSLARSNDLLVTVAYVLPMSALATPQGAALATALHAQSPIGADRSNAIAQVLASDPTTAGLSVALEDQGDSLAFTFAFGAVQDDPEDDDQATDESGGEADDAETETKTAAPARTSSRRRRRARR